MKVLVVSHMYPSAQNPTYGIFIQQHVKALIDQGCEVKVISPVPYAPWPLTVLKKKWRAYAAVPQRDVIDGVEVFYPRYPEFPRSFLLAYSGLLMFMGIRRLAAGLLKEFQYDLIHAHVAIPDGHAAYLLKKNYRLPVIVTIHGQDLQSTLHKGKSCRARLDEVLGGSDRIITVSSKLQNIVEGKPYFAKTTVINNGIDLYDCQLNQNELAKLHNQANNLANNQANVLADRKATQGQEQDHSLEQKEIRMISVSNLKKTKGIDLNLQALAALVPKYPNLQYIIVGDGEERQNLEALTDSLGLRSKVVFTGRLPHSEVIKQMAAADLFSLPSWQEGFGVVYIEAMALGVPVIGVRGEGIEDVIISGQNGLLVEPRNVQDLTGAVDNLLSRPDFARQLAEAGRDTVLKGYTWEQNALKTMAVYRKVLEQNVSG